MRSIANQITLVGHPYAPIGMGEHVRCSFRALRSVGIGPSLLDVYGLSERLPADVAEFGSFITDQMGAINIFHINGDEVAQVIPHLGARIKQDAFNIIYPAWELAHYPQVWADRLQMFDEIWAPSEFIAKSLATTCHVPIKAMPLACEVVLSSLLSRRYFDIPEQCYAFLFFFDFRSYATRKNPSAVIEAFTKAVRKRPQADCCLVVKTNGSAQYPDQWIALSQTLAEAGIRHVLLDNTMTDNEVKNLVRVCDCFVSLHRSEGFGRGLSEAMYLEKPVISTGYSGNMDFMSKDNALLVDYKMIAVKEGEYPHWQDQVWADADVDQASDWMVKLLDQPALGRALGKKAATHVRRCLSYRSVGNRYRNRVDEILDLTEKQMPEHAATEIIE